MANWYKTPSANCMLLFEGCFSPNICHVLLQSDNLTKQAQILFTAVLEFLYMLHTLVHIKMHLYLELLFDMCQCVAINGHPKQRPYIFEVRGSKQQGFKQLCQMSHTSCLWLPESLSCLSSLSLKQCHICCSRD